MGKDAAGGSLRKVAPQVRPAADFAYSQLGTAVPLLLAACGFHGGSANACMLLTELVQRYLALLARQSAASAHAANRNEANVWDVALGLEHVMGPGALAELQEWADDEGLWRRDTTSLFPEPVLEQRARLAEYLLPRAPREKVEMHYLPLTGSMQANLEVRRAKEEVEAEAFLWASDPPDAAHLGGSAAQPANDVGCARSAERCAECAYIPSYLPPLPDWEALERANAQEALHEEEAPKEDAGAARVRAPRPAPVLPAPGAAELDAEGIRRVWRRRAPVYMGSLAESAAPATHFPSLEAALGAPVPSATHKRTSLEAFVHATEELAAEAPRTASVYLTSLAHSHHVNPNASAFVDGAVKRRRLAHAFADPQRYVPNDSMHGCVHVHPASPAWAPGPSLLITIPSAQGSAEEAAQATPVFTPVHPHGRSVALAPPAGALAPTLAYRAPAHLYTGTRMVAPPSLLRAMVRMSDPPALLDDHHTERVFHGMTASRTLMTGTMMSVQHRHSLSGMVNRFRGGNSILHPALERLRFSLAAQLVEQRRQLHAEEQAEELDEEPIRGERIKMPMAGTLVYAWDWPTVLPWVEQEERAERAAAM